MTFWSIQFFLCKVKQYYSYDSFYKIVFFILMVVFFFKFIREFSFQKSQRNKHVFLLAVQVISHEQYLITHTTNHPHVVHSHTGKQSYVIHGHQPCHVVWPHPKQTQYPLLLLFFEHAIQSIHTAYFSRYKELEWGNEKQTHNKFVLWFIDIFF